MSAKSISVELFNLMHVVYANLCVLPLGTESIYKFMEYLVGYYCSI